MGISKRGIKTFLLYEARWQASSPVLALCMWLMGGLDIILATVIANLIGGCIFYFVDKKIFGGEE